MSKALQMNSRSHASAAAYDPFEDTRGPVGLSPHFDVERLPGTAAGDPARFIKALRPGAPDDLLAMLDRENMLLMEMTARRVPGVAQTLSFARDSSDAAFDVTTLDAGPSLNLWRQRVFVPLADPAAPAGAWLTPRLALQMLRRLLLVLRGFHAHGYVHVDLHAGNVCIPFERSPAEPRALRARLQDLRLIDFGHTLSPRLRFDDPLRIDPDAAESVRRVSPALREALRSDASAGRAARVLALDGRVDLYALGVLAAQWLDALNWAAEPNAAAWFPVFAGCVDRLRALDSSATPAAADLHDSLLHPLEQVLGDAADAPGAWLIPLPRTVAAAAPGPPDAARETPLVLPAGRLSPAASTLIDAQPAPPLAAPASSAAAATAPAPARSPARRTAWGVSIGLLLAASAALAVWAWRSGAIESAGLPWGVQSGADPLTASDADGQLADMARHAIAGRWSQVDAAARAVGDRLATAPPAGSATAALTAAMPDIEAGAYADAAATLRAAAADGAEHWRLWSALGYAALREGRLDEARQALRRSLRMNPGDASAWAHLGEIEAVQGEGASAMAMLRLAVYYSNQRARTLAHLRATTGSRIAPAFQDVVSRAGRSLDEIPSRTR